MKSIPSLIAIGGTLATALVTTTGTSFGLTPTAASPTSTCVTTYLAPSFPFAITDGPGGEYYGAGNLIVRVRPNGDQQQIPLPNPDSAYVNWLARRGSRIWFGDGGSGEIGYLSPNGTFTEWATPAPVSGAAGIVFLGKDVWFTSPGTNQVGMFDPRSGQFTMYDMQKPNTWPLGITVGPEGNLWIVERTAHRVVEMTPGGQIIKRYRLSRHAFPNRIVTFDGGVWFTELKAGLIGNITNGNLTETAVDGGPVGITVQDDNLYVAMYTGNQVAKLDSTGHVAKTWDVPEAPLQMAAGAGSVWTTAAQYVAKVDLVCDAAR